MIFLPNVPDSTPFSFVFHAIQSFSYPQGHSQQQPLHRHPETMELLLVLEGNVHCTIDTKTYKVSSGTVLFIQPGSWHELKYTAAEQQNGYRLSFIRNLSTEHAPEAELPPVIPISDLTGLEALFVQLHQETDHPQADSKQMVHHLIEMIVALLSRFGDSRSSIDYRNFAETIRKVKHFMEENHCRSLTLENLADEFSLDKYQLARLFKQHTGMKSPPIHHFLPHGHSKTAAEYYRKFGGFHCGCNRL
ncbi:AraC family transcriptional regulator [Planococcus antarcticus DSM 14505]|uniref:AraC family transcriptional regulator n=1 Tax=Planococcus antarcticus DSM 14505 TaxID=1185653 RepID=A0AA87LVB9_9BACL|nr:AraC family transcriptional regulator [Planococcus antarcticus DSM 14505]